MKCPLKNYEYSDYVDCIGDSCAFADEAGDCLIRQALQCYVSAERTRVAEETERKRKEIKMMEFYWLDRNKEKTPIQFTSVPESCPYPHSGMYEDLSNLREKFEFKPPRIDNSYITL